VYLPIEGDHELAKALAHEMRVRYAQSGEDGMDVDVKREDIAISGGCNMAYVAAVMALCDPGDEIILPVPWYFNMQYVLIPSVRNACDKAD
jgi:aspartate/methionine/tyrosine aminotransferase